ncbi:MAG: cytochrome bd-I oxidase subunit CydX [Steroidobacteraceae bacterium]
MWYFTWVLGLGLAMIFGIVNAIWYEIRETEADKKPAP